MDYRLDFGVYNEVEFMDKSIFDNKARDEWEWLINQWVLDEVAKKMLIRHFLDGIPYERIAEELDVSRATVYNKIKKYSAKLFKHC